MSKKTTQRSKFLSLVLRHKPETIGIQLDEQGWVDVDVLLAAMGKHQRGLTRTLHEWRASELVFFAYTLRIASRQTVQVCHFGATKRIREKSYALLCRSF